MLSVRIIRIFFNFPGNSEHCFLELQGRLEGQLFYKEHVTTLHQFEDPLSQRMEEGYGESFQRPDKRLPVSTGTFRRLSVCGSNYSRHVYVFEQLCALSRTILDGRAFSNEIPYNWV